MMHEDCKSFSFYDWLNWEVSGVHDYEEFNSNKRWDERNYYYDPIDLLPVDPFGMNLDTTMLNLEFSTKLSAAIAGWIGLDDDDDDYPVNNNSFVTGLSYYCNNNALSLFETQLNSRGPVDYFSDNGLLGQSPNAAGNDNFLAIEDVSIQNAIHTVENSNLIHDGLILSLGHLGLQDLISVEMVCRSLRFAVQTDTLLWRSIHIDFPLSEEITDDDLFRLSQRAQGSLQLLSLVQCPRITDVGLRRVLCNNLRLKKLNISGCVRLTVNGLITSFKALKLISTPEIKVLKLGRLFIASPEQFAELKFLAGIHDSYELKDRKLKFYHSNTYSLSCDDDCVIDIEKCPKCHRCRLVFDCSLESCLCKGRGHCRACNACIPRCVQCGRCLNDCEYIETFCLEFACFTCWDQASSGEEDMQQN